MSDYHAQMMNIQTPEGGRIKYNLDEYPGMTDVIAYMFGHRDARHAAAEIANKADQCIEELEANLAAANQRIAGFEQLLATIEAHEVQLESCDRDGQQFCDCLERAIAALKAKQ